MEAMFSFSEFTLFLIKRLRILVVLLFVFFVIGALYSFKIAQVQFCSSIEFLPPFEQSTPINLIPAYFNTGSKDVMPQQISSIFSGMSLRRKVIDKFNYIEKYELTKSPNKYGLAEKKLNNDLIIETEEMGSLGMTQILTFRIYSYHTSADTSYQIATYVFNTLDSIISEIGIDKGRRNRIFVKNQLESAKARLDSLESEYIKFQKENKLYNIENQIKLSLSEYSQLRAQYVANELKIKKMLLEYNKEFPQLESLKKENRLIKYKLNKIETSNSPGVAISLESASDLFPRYSMFIRDIEIQNKLILLLTQQLEEAKIKEAKDFSTLKVIDEAFVPEYKSRPKRLFLLITITGILSTFMLAVFFMQFLFEVYISKTKFYNDIIRTIHK